MIDNLCVSSSMSVREAISKFVGEDGKGTRLYPYTKILSKAIIPVGEYSIPKLLSNPLRNMDVGRSILVLNHGVSLIKAYLNESGLECKIDYVQETEFAGTAGGLCLWRLLIGDMTAHVLTAVIISVDAALTRCAYTM